MKYSILAAALLLAACGGNGSDSTANTVEVVADDQPTATETSVAPTPTPEPGVSSQPEQIQQPTAPVAQPTIAAGPCVDTAPVGDGFGWNGVASCTLPVVEATPPLEPEAVPDMPLNVTTPVVADTRIGECVDEDGDGLGFDGFVSCRLSIASDPSWAYCETDINLPDVELEFGQTWGKQRDRSDEIYPCVRRCGATAFELPNTPGWSYDPDAAAECIVDEDTNSDVFIELAENVPVYDIKSGATERQSFQDQFAYPLYYGDASWECSRETRQSNSEEFVAVGAPRNITFDDTFFGNWYFDRRQWKQTLTINDNSDQDGLFEYTGYAQIEHDKLAVYQTSNDRLSCERSGSVPDATLPLTINEFQNAENLLLDDLLDQTYQCQLLESLGRSENVSHDLGWNINSIQDISLNVDLTFNPTFSSFNDSGERLYESTEGYLFTDTGQIDRSVSPAFSGYQFSGDRFYRLQQGTSTFYGHLLAKRIGNNIMLEKNSFTRASGGGADNLSYYVCPVGG